ncbi:hypothetical protein GEMRC1_007658 [Eukaryota sp. GEM-RC1]
MSSQSWLTLNHQSISNGWFLSRLQSGMVFSLGQAINGRVIDINLQSVLIEWPMQIPEFPLFPCAIKIDFNGNVYTNSRGSLASDQGSEIFFEVDATCDPFTLSDLDKSVIFQDSTGKLPKLFFSGSF